MKGFKEVFLVEKERFKKEQLQRIGGRGGGKKRWMHEGRLSNKRQSDLDVAPVIHGTVCLTHCKHTHTHIQSDYLTPHIFTHAITP